MKSIYTQNRLFVLLAANVLLFVLSFSFPQLFIIAQVFLAVIILLFLLDIILLFSKSKALSGKRNCKEKLSNGDENDIFIYLKNYYPFIVDIQIIDEIPIQFQYRNFLISTKLKSKQKKQIQYALRPVERGEYQFGALNFFVSTALGLAIRRFRFDQNQKVLVYPSYLQLRKFELLAISNRLSEAGVKKIRKLGHNMEFEQG